MESKYNDDEEASSWGHGVKYVEDKDVKGGSDSDSEDDEADREFERIRRQNKELAEKRRGDDYEEEERRGSFVVDSSLARKIIAGFKINYMNMRDADTGELLWQSDSSWGTEMFQEEKEASIPREILVCRAVSREINFSSEQAIDMFRLEQRVFLSDECIEEWSFRFGFVIPGSTNSWQQIIEAAGDDKMLAAEVLSGNLVMDTSFYNGSALIARTQVRIFYE